VTRSLAAFLILLASLTLAPAPSPAQSPSGAFCGTVRRPPRYYKHVVWVWLENHDYTSIIGNPTAAFINSLAAGCGLATNFHNITHFSLPNYIGAVTGLGLADLQPYLLDCNPGVNCQTSAESIFSQAASWKAYQESMPTNCAPSGFSPYGVRHNPPVYLTGLAATCGTFDVPYTELQADLDNDTLPAFSFVTPNNINNMHDNVGNPIQNGDDWVRAELPKILNSQAYQRGETLVFLTFDEGEFGTGFAVGEDCAKNTTDPSCRVATIVIAPSVRPGATSARVFNHYSMLRTTEQVLGIPKKLGLARRSRLMRSAFHF
jgi:hypothetical protein